MNFLSFLNSKFSKNFRSFPLFINLSHFITTISPILAEMSSGLIVAGLGLAAAGFGARYVLRNQALIKKGLEAIPVAGAGVSIFSNLKHIKKRSLKIIIVKKLKKLEPFLSFFSNNSFLVEFKNSPFYFNFFSISSLSITDNTDSKEVFPLLIIFDSETVLFLFFKNYRNRLRFYRVFYLKFFFSIFIVLF